MALTFILPTASVSAANKSSEITHWNSYRHLEHWGQSGGGRQRQRWKWKLPKYKINICSEKEQKIQETHRAVCYTLKQMGHSAWVFYFKKLNAGGKSQTHPWYSITRERLTITYFFPCFLLYCAVSTKPSPLNYWSPQAGASPGKAIRHSKHFFTSTDYRGEAHCYI